MFVKFWGTRGSIPTPGHRTQRYGGNTPCLEIRAGDATLVCDGGTGLRDLGIDLMRRAKDSSLTIHLFFSHPHWDHIQGFPFFTPAYAPTNTLHVYGPSRGDRTIHDLLSGQMQSSYFPVSFADLGARLVAEDLESGRSVGGVKVRTLGLVHPGGSVGFSFEHRGTKVVYATDNEIDLKLPDAKRIASRPNTLRRIPEAMVTFARDADLLIADGQFTDEEYPKRIGWGHPRASTVVDLAVRAHVKQLVITHHDPMHSDSDVDALIATCALRARHHGSRAVVFGAREGVELKVD